MFISRKNMSVISLCFWANSMALANPNNPPECDPNSPGFAVAAREAVVIVVPSDVMADLGYVLDGCNQAKQAHMKTESISHNCVVIKAEDFNTAVNVFKREKVPIRGVFSQINTFNSSYLESRILEIGGALVLRARPRLDELQKSPENLKEYGYSGYNVLKGPKQ